MQGKNREASRRGGRRRGNGGGRRGNGGGMGSNRGGPPLTRRCIAEEIAINGWLKAGCRKREYEDYEGYKLQGNEEGAARTVVLVNS